MNDWIGRTFQTGTSVEGWEVFTFTSGGNSVEANLDVFLAIFGDVSAPPTVVSLKAVDPENGAGWHRHFDAWHEQGIISAK